MFLQSIIHLEASTGQQVGIQLLCYCFILAWPIQMKQREESGRRKADEAASAAEQALADERLRGKDIEKRLQAQADGLANQVQELKAESAQQVRNAERYDILF